MAITIRGVATAWTFAASGSVTPTVPTHQSGDMLIARVAYKSSAIATCLASTATSGWTKLGEFHDGTVNSGTGSGSVAVAVFWNAADSASETNPLITFSQTVTQVGHTAIVYQKGGSEFWVTPVGDGGGFVVGAPVSATIQSHISVDAGDMIDYFLSSRDDTSTTSPSITQTGVTFGVQNLTPTPSAVDGSGADGSYCGALQPATAGPSSAAAVLGATVASETGSAWMTRLRVTSTDPNARVPRSTQMTQLLAH